MELREIPEPVGQRLRMQCDWRLLMMRGMAASRILVGHDGSPHADDALALGRMLSSLTGAELVLARIVPWEPLPLQAVPVPELKNRYEEQERDALAELQRIADRAGAQVEAGPGESPAQGLHLLAEELNPDIVVVGSSHRGRIGQVLAGNIAVRLLNGLHTPLAVAPAGYADAAQELHTIGVGFDGSPEARAALTDGGRAGPFRACIGPGDGRRGVASRMGAASLGLRVGCGHRP